MGRGGARGGERLAAPASPALQPAFPSPILRPGEEYRNQVVWRFYDVPPAPTPTEAPASASAASLACPAVLAGGLLAALLLA